MHKINDGGPAFPVMPNSGHSPSHPSQGMTLRDWCAGQALPAIILATSNGTHNPAPRGSSAEAIIRGIARDAYEMGDAMLAARAATAPEKEG